MPIPEDVLRRMIGVSLRPGCPVGVEELRYVRTNYWNFEGTISTGELVVHRDEVEPLRTAFAALFDARFPIRRMTLVDDFGPADDLDQGADDFASIEADNTSAFNCRLRTGSSTQFSEHSYGRAIDINPLENPYVGASGTTSHPRSVPFLDRTLAEPGVITEDSAAIVAFEQVGWGWGGNWGSPKDYQHFSRTGR